MALVDPNIAMGYRPPEIPNQLAQYGQLAQIQQAQNQNQLNQMQMQEYGRARTEEEGLRNFLRGRKLDTAESRAGLLDYGKTGREYIKTLSEQDAATATLAETRSKTGEREYDLKKKRLDASIKDFASFNTVGDVLGHIKRQLDSGDIDQATAQQLESQVPQSDAELPAFQIKMLRKTLGSKDQLDQFKVTTKDTDRGGYIERQTYDAQGKAVGEPVILAKTETIGERTAQGQLDVARQRLAQEGQSVTYQTDAEGYTIALPTKLAPGVVPTARSVMAPGGGVLPLKSPKDKGAAVSEQQAAYNIGRVLTAATQIGDINKKDPNAVQPGAGEAFAASIGMGGTANLARNANRQIVYGAQRDALDALLYLATGAAYNKEQLEGLATAYIPSYTDEPTTVVAKRERMTELINNAKVRAGKAWTPKMDAAMQALTNPTAAKAPAKATSGWGKAVAE